jgi:hypothetical protein
MEKFFFSHLLNIRKLHVFNLTRILDLLGFCRNTTVLKFKLVFIPANNSFQKVDVNFTSLSEITILGIPCSLKISFINISDDIYSFKSRFHRNKVCRLTEFIDYHHNRIILFLSFRQTCYKVQRYGLPFPFRH